MTVSGRRAIGAFLHGLRFFAAGALTIVLTHADAFAAESRPPAATTPREQAEDAFVLEMTQKHGFDAKTLGEAFESAHYRPKIVALMDKTAKRKGWDEYRPLFINEQKLRSGRRFWTEHSETLADARRTYGVPEEIIVAIIGIETHYGKHTGNFLVLEALKTLAFDYPRRADQFRKELEHFLLLSREESMPLLGPKGSYAGAMGIAQFMPGSYRRYAVDFDGDGTRDLFANPTDAIGSVANYFTAHGWRKDRPVAVQASVPPETQAAFRESKLNTRYRLDRLTSKGVQFEGAFPENARVVPIWLSSEAADEHWIGFDNFYVITRYNRSTYYAMAVYQLSEELRQSYELAQAAAGAND